jgi:uncharacterized protein (UPF0548 family)
MSGVGLTYAEVGATQSGDLPAGYRHVRRRADLGPAPAFPPVVAGLRVWGVHRGAGIAVRTRAPEPAVGVTFAAGLGVGRLRLWVPCTVVWVRDDAKGYGYGFGTRPGASRSATPAEPAHAALSGEEGFEVTLEPDGRVWFEIRAFSRPATWYARWGGPITRLLQDRVTDRYVLAARRLASAHR